MFRRVLSFFLSITCLLIVSVTVSSVSTIPHNLSTTPMEEKTKNTFAESVDLKLLKEQLPERTITCFDVSSSGLVAVAFDGASKHFVQVYDHNGTFLYGYEFNCSGIYGIVFVDGYVGIYFVRSNALGIYASDGQCVDLLEVPLTDSNREIVYELPRRTQKEVNGLLYKLERDFGLWDRSYSRLMVTDIHGQTTVFYDATKWYFTNLIFETMLVCGFGSVGVILLIKKYKCYEDDGGKADSSTSSKCLR